MLEAKKGPKFNSCQVSKAVKIANMAKNETVLIAEYLRARDEKLKKREPVILQKQEQTFTQQDLEDLKKKFGVHEEPNNIDTSFSERQGRKNGTIVGMPQKQKEEDERGA